MKRYLIIILIIILLLSGCSKGKNAFLIAGSHSHNNHEKAMHLVQEYLNKDEKEIKSINLIELDENYLITEIKSQEMPYNIQGEFVLIDIENEVCTSIRSQYSKVKNIYLDNNDLIFEYDGTNTLTNDKSFPYQYIYNIKDNKYKIQTSFKELNYDTNMGSFVNQLKFESIKFNDNYIQFNYSTTDQTVFLESLLSPHVNIDYIYTKKSIYIDFENVILNEKIKNDLNNLTSLDFITNVNYKTYKDPEDNIHTILYLKLHNVQKYKCDFVDSPNSTQSLKLYFK